MYARKRDDSVYRSRIGHDVERLNVSGIIVFASYNSTGTDFVKILAVYRIFKTDLIYSVSLLGGSFLSMCLSLLVSFALYVLALAVLYIVSKKSLVFKMHKKVA